jgi:Tfp pilus assembly protein PilO
VSGQTHGTSLLRRVLAEHRRVVTPLTALFVINILVYAVGVYPLARRVANIEQRERAADQALAQARREHDAATGALTGKEQATVELATFYKDVLPADYAGARRLTYLRLAQLAREAGLRLQNYSSEIDDRRENSTLERVRIQINLQGGYDDIRAFLYQLDTAPEFVVIDDVRLREGGGDASRVLDLTMQLSTYYRAAQR